MLTDVADASQLFGHRLDRLYDSLALIEQQVNVVRVKVKESETQRISDVRLVGRSGCMG